MKLKKPMIRFKWVVILSLCVIFGMQNAMAQEEPVKIAIIPFTIHAEKDHSYLKKGIVDMLSSRLSYGDHVTVIRVEDTESALQGIVGSLDEAQARDVGKTLGARYVLMGSMTIFGTSVSFDAKLLDIMEENPPLSFYTQSQGMEQVIPQISLFAGDINRKVFGRVPEEKGTTGQTEKTDRQPSISGGEALGNQGEVTPSEDFWKSESFSILFNGLSLGDVDGDGKTETVIVSSHTIYIYRHDNNRFSKIKEIEAGRYKRFIGVDVGDINGNGIEEIFVSSLNAQRNVVSSLVYEFNGEEYIQTFEDQPWKYRIIKQPGQPPLLFGQKLKLKSTGYRPVFEMHWTGAEYESKGSTRTSRPVDLMGFSTGDVMNIGENAVVAYSQGDKIQIFDTSGTLQFDGAETYGGSTLYYDLGKSELDRNKYQFLPMRILITDLNADGLYEIIAAKNYGKTAGMLENFRMFTHAHMESFSWDGLGPATNWKTKKIFGSVRDFAVADFDNDGRPELVAAVIIKERVFIGAKSQSTVIAFELN